MTSGTKPAEYYRDQYGIHPVFTITQDLLYAPVSGEPSGGTWHKVSDPATGWLASKTSGWTADSFSGGLTVDFSAVVPANTKAIRAFIIRSSDGGFIMYRKGGDASIANNPIASGEYSHGLHYNENTNLEGVQAVIWLSATYTADFAVHSTDIDLFISRPIEYLL